MQARAKGGVAQVAAQHVEQHQALAIADGLGRRAVAALKGLEREVLARLNIVRVGLEAVAAVGGPLALPLLEQMIRQVGRQALAPIARPVIDEDAVAPPVMQNLVGIGTLEDEGQANDLGAQQGEGGHAVARLPEILHQGKLGVGVGADEVAVEGQVIRRGVEIALGQLRVRVAQIDLGLAVGRRLAIGDEGGGDEIDVILGLVLAPAHAGALGGRHGIGPRALGNGGPAGGQIHLECEALQAVREVGIPAAVAIQDDPVRADDAAGPLPRPAHPFLGPLQVAAQGAGIAQGDGSGPLPAQAKDLPAVPGAEAGELRLPRYHLGVQARVQDEGPVVLARRQAQGIRDGQRPLVRSQARLDVMADQGLGP